MGRKGGRTPSFNAVTTVGNRDGIVGLGFAGANEVPSAIAKSLADAKKNLIRIPLINGTIPHEIVGKYKACNVLLKPAGPGTGVIAGPATRIISKTRRKQSQTKRRESKCENKIASETKKKKSRESK